MPVYCWSFFRKIFEAIGKVPMHTNMQNSMSNHDYKGAIIAAGHR